MKTEEPTDSLLFSAAQLCPQICTQAITFPARKTFAKKKDFWQNEIQKRRLKNDFFVFFHRQSATGLANFIQPFLICTNEEQACDNWFLYFKEVIIYSKI